jgi:hypothetical protein
MKDGFPALISEWMDNGTIMDYISKYPDSDVMNMASNMLQYYCTIIDVLQGYRHCEWGCVPTRKGRHT